MAAPARTVPSWATSMVANYKRMFEVRFKRATKLSNEQVYDICETIWNDESSEQQDKDRVTVMLERETA